MARIHQNPQIPLQSENRDEATLRIIHNVSDFDCQCQVAIRPSGLYPNCTGVGAQPVHNLMIDESRMIVKSAERTIERLRRLRFLMGASGRGPRLGQVVHRGNFSGFAPPRLQAFTPRFLAGVLAWHPDGKQGTVHLGAASPPKRQEVRDMKLSNWQVSHQNNSLSLESFHPLHVCSPSHIGMLNHLGPSSTVDKSFFLPCPTARELRLKCSIIPTCCHSSMLQSSNNLRLLGNPQPPILFITNSNCRSILYLRTSVQTSGVSVAHDPCLCRPWPLP